MGEMKWSGQMCHYRKTTSKSKQKLSRASHVLESNVNYFNLKFAEHYVNVFPSAEELNLE